MITTYMYPAYCIPCLAKRECQSLPNSINCEVLRRVPDIVGGSKDGISGAITHGPAFVEVKP
jgi:hypothetical protein